MGRTALAFLACFACMVAAAPAYAEEVVTIYNGAGTASDKHFVDIDFYPLEIDRTLTWFNEDFVEHRIAIFAQNGTIIAESDPIPIRGSFSYTFENGGTYTFRAAGYPSVSGTVLVTDDIVTMNADYLKNGIDVQMSWTPATPAIGDTMYIKTVFVNKETGKNQEHVDHVLSVTGSEGNEEFPQSDTHISYGVQVTPYDVTKEDVFTIKSSIRGIYFAPVNPDNSYFALVTTPEFSGILAVLGPATMIAFAFAYRKKYGLNRKQ